MDNKTSKYRHVLVSMWTKFIVIILALETNSIGQSNIWSFLLLVN